MSVDHGTASTYTRRHSSSSCAAPNVEIGLPVISELVALLLRATSQRSSNVTTNVILPCFSRPALHTMLGSSRSSTGTQTKGSDWRSLCNARKAAQEASIPNAWRIKLPPKTCLDVRSVTEDCGLLSSRDIEIIDLGTKDVSALARLLADKDSGYTSLEVTTAYLKSAVVAHQVVSPRSRWFCSLASLNRHPRQTVLRKYSLSVPLSGQERSTSIWRSTGSPWVICTAYRSP
jgi:hypothetical protein